MNEQDKKVISLVKIIEEALIASPLTEIVTVEYSDGWYISVQDTTGNDFSVEVSLESVAANGS